MKRRLLGSATCSVLLFAAGCVTETGGGPEDPPPGEAPIPSVVQADEVDLLLVLDNSISMADKQAVLAPSVKRLLEQLINPPCVNPAGVAVAQPENPADGCPVGSERRSPPATNIHLGVISSSLGALTADQCLGMPNQDEDGHLLTRSLGGGTVDTYQDLGYLAWDPSGEMSPPGETDFDVFAEKAMDLVRGTDQLGCGYEMPLEAMYRFLADPAPYAELQQDDSGMLVPQGVDEVLLGQRESFLRPDSIVSVVLLSDENDCSISPSTQGYLTLGSQPFYRATSVCETNPNDACCTSCGLATPAGCAPDPACDGLPKYNEEEDHPNTRCWEQKRRYGVDFILPSARYKNALSLATIDPSAPDLNPVIAPLTVQNPLFAGGRDPQLVFFTAIVGVPWQDLATDPTDPTSRFKTTPEMAADGTWSWIVGDNGGAPTDPFMIESKLERTGFSPATGASPAGANPINGGDRADVIGDLQYACIFDLETPIVDSNDCYACGAGCSDPLCDGATQIAAKAYPGRRQLEVVRQLGSRGIAGSICTAESTPPVADPSSSTDPTVRAYAYNQPMESLAASMAPHISE